MRKVDNPYVSPATEDAGGLNRVTLLTTNGLAWLLVVVGTFCLQAWIMPLFVSYGLEILNVAGYLFPFALPTISAALGIGFSVAIAKTHSESRSVVLHAMSLLLAIIVALVAFSTLTFPLISLMDSLR